MGVHVKLVTLAAVITLLQLCHSLDTIITDKKTQRKITIVNPSERFRRELDSWVTENGDHVSISNAVTHSGMQKKVVVDDKRRKKRDLTAAEETESVDAHNAHRMDEGAADMRYMYWNDDLASLAQEWAEGCDFVHGQPSGRTYTDYSSDSSMGQNLYATTASSVSMTAAIQAWFDEKEYYTFGTQACSHVCGHYTQVVWASSYEVGCGVSQCTPLYDTSGGEGNELYSSGSHVVCNYGPPGNYQGQDPYESGDSCTRCASGEFLCRDNMCDSCTDGQNGCTCEASNACENCANITDSCGCACADGYTGVACSEPCEDTHRFCNNGWWAANCNSNTAIPDGCPLMCGVCNAATADTPSCNSGNAINSCFKTAALLSALALYVKRVMGF